MHLEARVGELREAEDGPVEGRVESVHEDEGAPLATAAQCADPLWWLLVTACFGVIVAGYHCVWPRGTFTDGRRRHTLLSLGYGAVWGLCQGLWFLVIWSLIARSGWPTWAWHSA